MKRLIAFLLFCALAIGASAAVQQRHTAVIQAKRAGGSPSPISFVAAAGSSYTTASPTVAYPAVAANDIMLAVFSSDSTHTASGTPPTGWTLLHELDEGAADCSTTTFWKRATGSEGASEEWTSLFTSAESGRAIVIAYRNCTTSGLPFDAQATPEDAGAGTISTINIDTTVTNTMVIGIVACDPGADTRTFTWDASITERINNATTPSGLAAGFAMITIGEKASPTATTVTMNGSWDASDNRLEFAYALKQ